MNKMFEGMLKCFTPGEAITKGIQMGLLPPGNSI